MKILILAAGLLTSPWAFAGAFDVVTCKFGNLMMVTTYSEADHTLKIEQEDADTYVLAGVSLIRIDDGHYVVLNSNNSVLQDLTLNYLGSDRMTGKRYPLDAAWMGLTDTYSGGCSTNYFPKYQVLSKSNHAIPHLTVVLGSSTLMLVGIF